MDRRSDYRNGLIALALLVTAMISLWAHKQFAAAKAAGQTVVAMAPAK